MNKKIEKLANEMLEKSGTYRKYSDIDLANATFIFIEIMLAKTWEKHRNKVNKEGMMMLAEELGKSIRQTIKLYTGVDMYEVVGGKLSKKEIKKVEKIIKKLI